jgi:hypothetical protein
VVQQPVRQAEQPKKKGILDDGDDEFIFPKKRE